MTLCLHVLPCTHFQAHLLTDVTGLQDKPAGYALAGGSVYDSLHSSGMASP